MAVDPQLLAAIDVAVRADPANRALRLHLADLLLDDGQHVAALGHCELLLQQSQDDADALARKNAALAGFGMPTPTPQPTATEQVTSAPQPPPTKVPQNQAWATADGDDDAIPVSDLMEIVRPEFTLDDVAGMDDVKQRLRMSFLEPMRNEELRKSFGHALRSSLLLWGPPGCGKTFLAKSLAGELGLFFIHVGIADILDKWLGNSERNIKGVFEEARQMRPTVLFIDELDALGHKRAQTSSFVRSIVNQLLLELDGATSDNEGLLVLGATNQVWDVDPALLRPGRFDRKVLVLPPDRPAREAILAHHLRTSPTDRLNLATVADRTDGYSGADLAGLCRGAVEFALHDSVRRGSTQPVNQRHLDAALKDTQASTTSWFSLAQNYVAFAENREEYAELERYLVRRKKRR
ncbi:ATP-binding protein [Mycolicibacterium lutetiense]|uniref:SpoVK/Ycf46/Vps4 family AAA+-type ATPase n=1 Tax=Mycolicibacterium lutetiense TaxID=1641992 RepID=A0ABS4ZT88_9MYCO|nr:ATP-binding protein [Mycolicibacterium lutetiense]MBP2452715.1 SpoVK/Ycf46/Vps4 family AAA+-type ATPase [Mycolicibacterium lutetiense]